MGRNWINGIIPSRTGRDFCIIIFSTPILCRSMVAGNKKVSFFGAWLVSFSNQRNDCADKSLRLSNPGCRCALPRAVLCWAFSPKIFPYSLSNESERFKCLQNHAEAITYDSCRSRTSVNGSFSIYIEIRWISGVGSW